MINASKGVCFQLQMLRSRQGRLTFVGEERLVKAMLRLFMQVRLYKRKHYCVNLPTTKRNILYMYFIFLSNFMLFAQVVVCAEIVSAIYIIDIYVKKLHSLYKLCKGDFVVGDVKLQRSPLQNSKFVITLSVGFVLTMCKTA